jgi:predicted transcriptional regulator
MSHYSHALQEVIVEHFGGAQLGFATKCKISQAVISKHCAGTLRPKVETLEKICKSLPAGVGARLVVAHLQDETPASARYYLMVNLHTKDGAARMEEKPDSKLDHLDRKTRKAIEFIAEKAIENKDARDALQHTAKFLGCEL